MSKNEKITDFLIGEKLNSANINFTPNGSSIKEIQDALKTASKKGNGNAGFPEFTAKVKNFILVIEDKAEIDKQVKYSDDSQENLATDTKSIMDYAENGALHYALQIIEKTNFKKVFAFGCAGDKKHHIIRPIFVDESGYKLLEPIENFENFSKENIERYYKEQVLEETPIEVKEKDEILSFSKELHEHLRNYGQLGDSEKPLVVSAILLALSNEENFKISDLNASTTKTDGVKIYEAIEDYMIQVDVSPNVKKEKVLHQFLIIKDRSLLSRMDERIGKTPLKYFSEFLETKVLKSIKENTRQDILGRFYGEFIRYSGGDGQTLGVVLTPTHITELFAELVEIKETDRVFDPCCGTGGFLISAMHYMLKLTEDEKIKQNIKQNQLHGIEIREDMFSVATTNMILRGDGKSNLENQDFLRQSVQSLREKNLTVGFINPPYSQAKNKETSHLSEINFIKHMLDGLADNARGVAIVPQSTMVGKTKIDKQIKKQILQKHTLEGVITLNKETFYGVGTNVCIAIFTAHKPHYKNKYCKFINFEDDGFVVRKHLGLVETERAKEKRSHLLDCWLHGAPAETKFMVQTTVEPEDEWLHSFYYFNDEVPKTEDFEKTISDYLTFEFGMVAQGRKYLFKNKDDDSENSESKKKSLKFDLKGKEWKEFLISGIFDISGTYTTHPSNLKKGNITPRVTCSSTNNAFDGMYKNSPTEKEGVITIDSATVGYVSYQPYDFIATDHVEKLTLKNNSFMNKFLGNFFVRIITASTLKKYGYGYKFSQKRIKKQIILLPTNSKGEPDYQFMEEYIKQIENEKIEEYKKFIKKRLPELQKTPKTVSVGEKEWGEFETQELFETKIGKNIDGNKINKTNGKIPYITRKEVNNGLDGFINYDKSFLNKNFPVITIGNETAEPFVQRTYFFTGTKVNILNSRKKISDYSLSFVATSLRQHKNKYSYSFTINSTRLKKQKILLPLNQKKEPDYEFMENFMKNLELKKLKEYLEFKKIAI